MMKLSRRAAVILALLVGGVVAAWSYSGQIEQSTSDAIERALSDHQFNNVAVERKGDRITNVSTDAEGQETLASIRNTARMHTAALSLFFGGLSAGVVLFFFLGVPAMERDVSKAVLAQLYINIIHTPRGPVTLTWRSATGAPTNDPEDIITKVTEILNAHPDDDLHDYAAILGISIVGIKRSSTTGLLASLELALSKCRSLIEADRARKKFLAENGISEDSELGEQVNMVFSEYEGRLRDPESR